MDYSFHTINSLFDQLGLPSDNSSIERFVDQHKPVNASLHIDQLPFFSHAQQDFLRQSIRDDADWSEVIDILDNMLREDADIRPS